MKEKKYQWFAHEIGPIFFFGGGGGGDNEFDAV